MRTVSSILALTRNDICPAPYLSDDIASEAIGLSKEKIESLLADDPENSSLQFILGNLYLLDGDEDRAATVFRAACAVEESAELRCNLAISLWRLGQEENALREFKRTLLLDPRLSLAHYHIGHLYYSTDDFDRARAHLQSAAVDPLLVGRARAALGAMLIGRGENSAGVALLEAALEADSENQTARTLIGRTSFDVSVELLTREDLFAGLIAMRNASRAFGDGFSSDRHIATTLHALRSTWLGENRPEKALRLFQEQLTTRPLAELCYETCGTLLFCAGIYPEYFVTADEVDEAQQYWQNAADGEGDYPIAVYWNALLHVLQGRIDEAMQLLLYCQDTIPPSKQYGIHLHEVIEIVKRLRVLIKDANLPVEGSSEDEWDAAGFTSVFEQRAWAETGLTPTKAQSWRAQGFTPEKSKLWAEAGIVPITAQRWIEVGFDDPKEVRQWQAAALAPEQALTWRDHFPGAEAKKALQCLSIGIPDPVVARAWIDVFPLIYDAAPWLAADFAPDVAHRWRKAGINDPYTAREREKQGFTPEEVERRVAEAKEGFVVTGETSDSEH